jgi:hypothetical protein
MAHLCASSLLTATSTKRCERHGKGRWRVQNMSPVDSSLFLRALVSVLTSVRNFYST